MEGKEVQEVREVWRYKIYGRYGGTGGKKVREDSCTESLQDPCISPVIY